MDSHIEYRDELQRNGDPGRNESEPLQMMKITVYLHNTKFIQTQIPAANRGVTPNQLFAELLEDLIRKRGFGEY